MELNYVRVKSTIPRKQGFAFVDTKKNLADGIFIKHKLFVKFGKEFEKPGEKYKIIFCHVDRKRASDFKDCMKELVDKMLLLGNTDYEEFCESLEPLFGHDKEKEKEK